MACIDLFWHLHPLFQPLALHARNHERARVYQFARSAYDSSAMGGSIRSYHSGSLVRRSFQLVRRVQP